MMILFADTYMHPIASTCMHIDPKTSIAIQAKQYFRKLLLIRKPSYFDSISIELYSSGTIDGK